jgi:hypothetical protein
MLDEDLATEDLPNLTALDEEFPSLMKFLFEGPPVINQFSASQLCQLTADLYTLAARHFWEDAGFFQSRKKNLKLLKW